MQVIQVIILRSVHRYIAATRMSNDEQEQYRHEMLYLDVQHESRNLPNGAKRTVGSINFQRAICIFLQVRGYWIWVRTFLSILFVQFYCFWPGKRLCSVTEHLPQASVSNFWMSANKFVFLNWPTAQQAKEFSIWNLFLANIVKLQIWP